MVRRAAWSKRAREHALKLRNSGMSDAEIGAVMGRSAKSVSRHLAGFPRVRKRTTKYREFYNRVEMSSMLGLTVNEFMRHQIELEEDHGLPRSTRSRYAVPRAAFDRWLKKREYPDLNPQEFAEKARAAFLWACFNSRPEKEINRAARILCMAETLLQNQDG